MKKNEYNAQAKEVLYVSGKSTSTGNITPDSKGSNYKNFGNDSILVARIARWLSKNPFQAFCEFLKRRVKGQPNIELVALNIFCYLKAISEGRKHTNNLILCAPSGTGKTETYRAVKDYFKTVLSTLKVCQYDMTCLTEEGYRGRDTNSLLEQLDPIHRGVGIVFLDEFDKKLVESFSSSGANINLAIQSQILTLIEGRVVYDNNGSMIADTTNTLFIAMGSFNACREKFEDQNRQVGFLTSENHIERTHYDEVGREDMIELGASHELIGRFSAVINYGPLTYNDVDDIIDVMTDKVSNSIGFPISISEALRKDLHVKANGAFGCRLLFDIIHEKAMIGYLNILRNSSLPPKTLILDFSEDLKNS